MFQSTDALLLYLNDLDVKLWVEGGKLRCSAPPGVLTSDLQAVLADKKVEIIKSLGKANNPVVQDGRHKEALLSFSQQRLWFLDQLEGPSWIYNIPMAWRFTGELDIAALHKSLDYIVSRHDILRTTFSTRKGRPTQIIVPHLMVELPVMDLNDLALDLREAEVQRIVLKESRYIFNLSQGPLLRFALLRLAPQEHIFLLTIHHIIFDGWSASILGRELSMIYDTFCTGLTPDGPALSVQYAAFAEQQQIWLQGEVLEKQLCYWKKQLAGVPPALEIPADIPRRTYQRFQGARHKAVLPLKQIEVLKALSFRQGGTLYMTLLAAFQLLLHRITGQEDIVVGAPIAGRAHSIAENTIGIFVNALALRTDFSGCPTFKELLRRVRDVTLDAYEYQDLPFEKIVEELQPDRNASRNPLFEVMFNLIDSSWHQWQLKGLTVCEMNLAEPPARFGLELYAREMTDGLYLDLVYQVERFSSERISTLMDQLVTLLVQIADNPEKSIDAYSLLTSKTSRLLPNPAILFNEPALEPVPGMFRHWAVQTPHQTAVIQGERSWTYQELADRAETLANHISSRGVASGEVVAVYGPARPEVIAGMMGVLMAGGVLLPIDDRLPLNRKRLMIEEASAKALICVAGDASIDPWWDAVGDMKLIFCDNPGESPDVADIPENRQPLPVISPEDPAYIFFTSGSTGVPKGVLGRHKSLSHFLQWQRQAFAIGPEDRVAQLTSLSFDPVLRDVFLPLTSGGCVVLPEAIDQTDILSWLEKKRITVLHVVPSAARFWLDKVPCRISLGHLRWVFFSGEPLSDALVDRWREIFPEGGQIVNFYGPTESTMVRCFYQVPEVIEPGIQPIGRPLPDSQALVLSKSGRLCGIGEPGEIVLRTPFLTIGYINTFLDQRTGFARNPFRDEERDRIYYTGDRGRFRPDGILEFLGRIDDQVKIDGVRIEPAEVAAVLTRHPAVKTGVVAARTDDNGTLFLAAYVVPVQPPPPGHRELRSFLLKHLPAVMVPRVFVNMEKLPLTPNGKTDFAALPEPDRQVLETSDSYEAPRTPTEIRLTNIWCDVLGIERMGIRDNFFESGGHSLLAVQVTSRIGSVFQIKLSVRALFEAPTIAELGLHVDRIQSPETPDDDKAIIPSLHSHPVTEEGIKAPTPHGGPSRQRPLSFAQLRLWFLHQLEPESPYYNIPMGWRLKGVLNLDALHHAFNAIVLRHEILRTTFSQIEDVPVQTIAHSIALDLPVTDLSDRPSGTLESDIHHTIEEEARRPFDLSRDSLMRCALLRLNRQDHILLVTMHHIVSDGWSMGLFTRELGVLYEAFFRGQPFTLPALPIQYADFAEEQHRRLKGEVLEREIRYWKKQLEGAPPVLELPTDRPRPIVQRFRGADHSVILPMPQLEGLRLLSRSENATLFMTLLAAFQLLLHRYTGLTDILVGAPIAGRTRQEVESLIGFFINTLVLRTDLSGNPTFSELLGRVRGVTLNAYEHQDLPFEKLVEELQPRRDLSLSPLFQVMFTLQNMPKAPFQLAELISSPIAVDSGISKFDLSLFANETEGGLHLRLVYNTDLFDRETIERMAAHFQTLLEGITANPDQRIGSLPILTGAERHQMLVSWNDTQRVYPRNRCIHQLFEDQAEKHPKDTALVFQDKYITYAELNARANQVAHYLIKCGVGPEVLVGVCMARSVDMVVGILGILKAGGAYVPLDPAYPEDRLSFMLADARIQLVVSQESFRSRMAEFQGRVIALDTDMDAIRAEGGDNPACRCGSENLAYVIYTSGSTGKPKGVAVEHAGVSALIAWSGETYSREQLSGVLASSSICFDISVFELFTPLCLGGKIVLAESILDLPVLSEVDRITLINTVPSACESLIHLKNIPASVRTINLAGEPLHHKLVQELFLNPTIDQVINLYGPTEDTVYSTIFRTEKNDENTPPIGRPIANTKAYVLDNYMQPVPVGVPGELHLGGAGLARGYLHRAELTEEKFISDPFTDIPGARLYRTGDRVRYRPDGNLIFLGRMDHQVKIRGYRIELGEIEAELESHPSVRSAVVIVREDAPGDKRLVAYCVPASGLVPDGEVLRGFLKLKLPDYMMPAAYVMLDAIPMMPNGKVNRDALPAPGPTGLKDAHTAPRTPVEEAVSKIWSEVLKTDSFSIHDNFFDLGGHSLLATRLISKLRNQFEIDLPLRSIFEAPTVAGLSLYVTKCMEKTTSIDEMLNIVDQLDDIPEDEARKLLVEEMKTSNRK